MRHNNDIRQNASGASRRLGAGLIALLAALGRQADDVARFAGRHTNDLGRSFFQQVDDLGGGVRYDRDDLLRGADDVTQLWTLRESRMTEPPRVVSAKPAADPGDHRGAEVLWHIAQKTAAKSLKSATENDKRGE